MLYSIITESKFHQRENQKFQKTSTGN